MRPIFKFTITTLAAAICFSRLLHSFEWKSATPESEGLSNKALDALRDELAARKTRAFLVIRNDAIVYEWYAKGNDANTKQGTASLAKALVGGMSLAVAINDGLIKLDDPAAKFIPEWKGDARKSKITIRQLGSHTSGLSDSATKGVRNEEQPGWMGDFWKRLPPPNDPFSIARDKAPVLFEPGSAIQYSNPGIGILNYCVTAAIKDSAQRDIRSLLDARVMRPIGANANDWTVGYGKTFEVNGLPIVGAWGGASYTPRIAARIGRLVLREGDWDGERVLSREAIQQVSQDAGLPGNCGMGWWTNNARRYAWMPRDAVWGAGAGDQVLLVVPSLNLIMVRNGETMVSAEELKKLNPKDVFEEYHDPRATILFKPLIEAVGRVDAPRPQGSGNGAARAALTPPYPPSAFKIEWAPKESIVRKGHDSDNWPLTWADDDQQYTAYGDGYGFEPFVSVKLGMGIARVEGSAENFTGVNIRAASAENTTSGKNGRKASGMLMCDGVLYMWARNAGNSQLAWSSDHGATWEWAEWKFKTSFGCPTYLNFGKNYSGARDEYVYVYSPDADSAYQPADRLVLARVPKSKIRQETAYEFLKALDATGAPVWTSSIADRGAVFIHAGRCFRSGVTYNAALKRYFLVQILPGTEGKRADTRFEGGFGVYDAREPWGPWTTVYFTEKWDVGPGESASFPAKWISADGKSMYLVFSGDDNFAVRKATLSTQSPLPR
ncbi:MAG TPA: serine hydrolase [Planctomycetota bacterium]|nr:serine hydrolase [Planctomycetota bacterium]